MFLVELLSVSHIDLYVLFSLFSEITLCIYFLSCLISVSSLYISSQKAHVSLEKFNSSLVNL